jgi:hypothetical protein
MCRMVGKVCHLVQRVKKRVTYVEESALQIPHRLLPDGDLWCHWIR